MISHVKLNVLINSSSYELKQDIEAIKMWLNARANRSQHTFDAYKKEATKLLNWLHSNNLYLKKLSLLDANNYFLMLEKSGITLKSVKQARVILNLMFSYLQNLGYLQQNVIKLTPMLGCEQELVPTRYLDLDAWLWLWRWLTFRTAKNDNEARLNARNRWLFALVYYTGIRREEVAKGKMSDFMYSNNRWVLKVIGKGKKVRYVSVNSTLLQELRKYRTYFNLCELPNSDENYGLVMPLRGNKCRTVTPRAIGLMIHEVRVKAVLDCEDQHILMQIKDMSTHWMRHTNTTHRYLAGASTETIQDEQGHADPKTTRIYLHTLPRQRQRDAEKLADLNIQELGYFQD